MAGRAGKVRDGTVGDERKSGRRNKCWYDSPNLIGCFTPKTGATKGKGGFVSSTGFQESEWARRPTIAWSVPVIYYVLTRPSHGVDESVEKPCMQCHATGTYTPFSIRAATSTLGKPNPESDFWVHDIELSLTAEKYDEFRVRFTYRNLIGVETKE
ncbi:hypothetical protein B296_00058151 [Ensete ventricosum]|uniref:Uncharacterized protein n=1 Tax=Ensete ventricosum TaxID=4639 RepID=A0A426XNG5_ENSVE|nr:hypothetical protein B296_00058151 [Ensete ventricosum]